MILQVADRLNDLQRAEREIVAGAGIERLDDYPDSNRGIG